MFHPRRFTIWGLFWTPEIWWLLHPRIVSSGCCLSEENFYLSFSSPPPVGSLCWALCLLSPILCRGGGGGGGGGRLASYEVSSVRTPPALGSGGGLHSSFLDSRLSLRPPVVVRRASPLTRGLSCPGLPRPRLLVLRLGRGFGGSFRSGGCFRPLVSRRGGRFHPCSGTSCHGERYSPFPVFSQLLHCGDLRGQLHSGSLSLEVRGYLVSLLQRNSSENLEVVGASRDHPSSAVCSGQSQCPCGLSLPPSSVSGRLGMDSSPRRLSGSLPSVASDGRPVCHLSKLPLFCLFLSLPGSSGSGDALQAYASPPWSIIPRGLAKLRAFRGTFLMLAAPFWPKRPWFPELLDLAVAPPVVLPSRPDLLFQPLSGVRHPDLLRL